MTVKEKTGRDDLMSNTQCVELILLDFFGKIERKCLSLQPKVDYNILL